MMTELEIWRADQHILIITAEGPKLVRKNGNGSEVKFGCEQRPVKSKKNGNGGMVLYWGANKPDNK